MIISIVRPNRQNLELLGSSCAIKAFLYRGLKRQKYQTGTECSGKILYSEQVHLK